MLWDRKMIEVTEQISIQEQELKFTASRSSGPGGQHVNKVSTRVMLWFDVANSPSLSDEQKHLVFRRLANRINKQGVLQVISQQGRSQMANRVAATERFVELLRKALRRKKPRRKTRIPMAAKECRIRDKKLRGRIKRYRATRGEENG